MESNAIKTFQIRQNINKHHQWSAGWLVGWLEFNVPFQHKMAISEKKGQGWRAILTQ